MVQTTRVAPESDRVLRLLKQILRDHGEIPLSSQAKSLGLSLSTAYRLVSRLRAVGLVRRCGRGAFSAGLELVELVTGTESRRLMARVARPHLKRLARRLRLTVHLGILEKDMLTYLIKEQGGGPKLFTRSGTQLEAYCSAIGKVLLAALPAAELDRYLGAGPMVPLTPNTIIEPNQLSRALADIRSDGYATDAEEVIENLRCIAVPIHDHHGHVAAAVSVSRHFAAGDKIDEKQILAALRDCVRRIEADI